MKFFFFLMFLLVQTLGFSQKDYWVTFKDKAESIYAIDKPNEFMSDNALARREKFDIPISNSDLPVCSSYVNAITSLGVEVNKSSKWLNGCLLKITDPLNVENVENLGFVKSIKFIGNSKLKTLTKKFQYTTEDVNLKNFSTDYGAGENQIVMLKGDFLHELNYRGKGIDIAIMDNGFPSVDTNRFYQKAFSEGRIIKGYDFVNDNDTLYDGKNGNHGNFVISTMVSDIEGELVGTAPDATYFLFSTEDNDYEGLREEYNWALAAEMADDLLGTNAIISTSLGYSNGFNISDDNHTYSEMDGNTALITIAADLAATKGFLVVNSAGNSGDDPWHYLTAPSDGDSVLCVGAVDKHGTVTGFSSRGPSFDNDVKPNVCAQGGNAIGVNTSGVIQKISGTSFSCPITAGMCASLWQAFPNKSNMVIFRAIEASAHLFSLPDDDFGYGIPNFDKAYYLLLKEDKVKKGEILIFPNPVDEVLNFIYKNNRSEILFDITVVNSKGDIVSTKSEKKYKHFNFYNVYFKNSLSKGIYYLIIKDGEEIIKSKFIKK